MEFMSMKFGKTTCLWIFEVSSNKIYAVHIQLLLYGANQMMKS